MVSETQSCLASWNPLARAGPQPVCCQIHPWRAETDFLVAPWVMTWPSLKSNLLWRHNEYGPFAETFNASDLWFSRMSSSLLHSQTLQWKLLRSRASKHGHSLSCFFFPMSAVYVNLNSTTIPSRAKLCVSLFLKQVWCWVLEFA